MDKHFDQWKKHCFSKVDLSKKGSVDEEIYPVVSLLNDSSNFFTTSSCSGRIILIDGVRYNFAVLFCSALVVSSFPCQQINFLCKAFRVLQSTKAELFVAVRYTSEM